MTTEQIVAAATVFGTGIGGAFAFIRWLVTTLNAAYKAQVDVTLAAKNVEIESLRDENRRLRDDLDRLRQRPLEAHG